MYRFRNRSEAGRTLALALAPYRRRAGTVVLAVFPGAVPVAYEVAQTLRARLDALVVRSLPVPGRRGASFGAVAVAGVRVLDETCRDVPDRPAITMRETDVVTRLTARLRATCPPALLAGRTAIIVDQGATSGSAMTAAILAARAQGAARVVAALPTAPARVLAALENEADTVVCPHVCGDAPGQEHGYGSASPVDLRTELALLARARAIETAASPAPAAPGRHAVRTTVEIDTFDLECAPHPSPPDARDRGRFGAVLRGDLVVPPGARGLVVFSHGSTSGRGSQRDRRLAHALQEAGEATLLVDLLTEAEAAADALTGALRFRLGLLTDRLVAALDWAAAHPSTARLPVGLFGAGTGGAVALAAAAARPSLVEAVVCRGARPDLAGETLHHVTTPTLLLVGAEDERSLRTWNRDAAETIGPSAQLALIEGAGHRFEERGTLHEVARQATGFFLRNLLGDAEPWWPRARQGEHPTHNHRNEPCWKEF